MVKVKTPALRAPAPAKPTEAPAPEVAVVDDKVQVKVTRQQLDALAAALPEGLVPPGARVASITLEFADE